MIGATVGVDDHVGHDVRAGWLHEDMDAAPRPRTAHRVADDPAHRVARGDWPRADELLAFLQHDRSEEHTSELQSLMRISYAVFCLKKKKAKPNSRLILKNTTHN